MMEGRIKNQIDHTWEKIQLSVLDEVKKLNLPENEQGAKIREIMKSRYKVDVSEDLGIESNTKVLKWFKSKNIYPLGLVLAFVVGGEAKNIKKILWGDETANETTITNTAEVTPVEQRSNTAVYTVNPEPVQKATEEPTPRSKELGPDVPEGVAKINNYFSVIENLPLPGRGYAVLDKTTANIYVFGKNNELVKVISALFGKTPGDDKNTVVKAGQGQMTTPAGIYIMSDSKTEADLKEFGPYQISLYGTTLEGEEVNLGLHPLWEEEFKIRDEAVNSSSTFDNLITNGCINIKKSDLIEIFNLFKKDYGEMFFVTPDQYSTNEFNIKNVVMTGVKKIRDNRLEKEIYYNKKIIESRDESEKKNMTDLYTIAVEERRALEDYIRKHSE